MSIVEVRDLRKEYGKKDNKTIALNGISLDIQKGEFVAIVGKSGSGKSTSLANIIKKFNENKNLKIYYICFGGVDTPTSGSILVDGEEIRKLKGSKLAKYRRNKVGIIYQFFNLLPILNVEENITLPASLDGRKIDKERLNNILEILELTEQRKKLPNQLSGGQQQRVSIGRALFNDPAIILADEPTGNLDSKNAEEVMKVLEDLNKKEGHTIIMITHDDELARRAGRMIVIEDRKC